MSNRLEGNVVVTGKLSCADMSYPDGSIENTAVDATAGIEATKLEHQHAIHYSQADGSDVVAAIVPVWTVRGVAGELVEVQVVCLDAPEGGDKKFTVDLKKCNAGSPAPATMLSAPIDYAAATPDCTVLDAAPVSGTLAAGDTLVVVVAVSGSTGNQGQGLVVTVTVREDAE